MNGENIGAALQECCVKSASHSIGLGVEAIATVLHEDAFRRSNGENPLMNDFTRGGLFDALKYIGKSIDNDQVFNGVSSEEDTNEAEKLGEQEAQAKDNQ